MGPWFRVRGLYGTDQMFHITDMSVPGDAGSYIFLFIPLFILFGWQQIIHIKKHGIHQLDWTGVVCLLFTTWVICFSYFGIMPWVAQITQWSKVDRKSTRLNSSHQIISYAVFCLKKKNI